MGYFLMSCIRRIKARYAVSMIALTILLSSFLCPSLARGYEVDYLYPEPGKVQLISSSGKTLTDLLDEEYFECFYSCEDYCIFVYYDEIAERQECAVFIPETDYFSGFIYHEICMYSDGLAMVITFDFSYGFIDEKGELVIPAIWSDAWDFCGDIAMVSLQVNTEEGYQDVCINKKGEIISLEPIDYLNAYDSAER